MEREAPRFINRPEPGFFLVEDQSVPRHLRPRLRADRSYVTASIYIETAQDDAVVLVGEIDGREIDARDLWEMRVYPISEAEYSQRRMGNG